MISIRRAKQQASKNAAKAKKRASGLQALLPGERLVVNYSSDTTACGCSSHSIASLPCTKVGTTSGPTAWQKLASGVDRCLLCGSTWEHRDYRTDPLVVLHLAPSVTKARRQQRRDIIVGRVKAQLSGAGART